MARIRSLKPEFFTSEDVVSLTPLARLLFQALWCEADREGRLIWKPGTFKLRYFPADACDIEALCQELIVRELVVLYGPGYACIPTFARHQHINPREAASVLPAPTSLSPGGDDQVPVDNATGHLPNASPPVTDASSRVGHASARVTDAPVTRREEGKGGERKGGEDASPRVGPAAPHRLVPIHGRRKLHCAHESAIGLDVPNDLHRELLARLENAGVPDAHTALCRWYHATEMAWHGRAIGDSTFRFWRARFAEWQGQTPLQTSDGTGDSARPLPPLWTPEDDARVREEQQQAAEVLAARKARGELPLSEQLRRKREAAQA